MNVATDKPDLRDVIRQLAVMQKQVTQLDDDIRRGIVRIEMALRRAKVQRVFSVQVVPGVDLGWSADHIGWRFVIREEDQVTRLVECEPDEWLEVLNGGAMARLLNRVQESARA